MDIKIMIHYLTGVLHVQKSTSTCMEKILQWGYKSERYMCGAYPEIGKRISLAMQWQFNEGIVCTLEIAK